MRAEKFIDRSSYEQNGKIFIKRTHQEIDVDLKLSDWDFIYENIIDDDYEKAYYNGF